MNGTVSRYCLEERVEDLFFDVCDERGMISQNVDGRMKVKILTSNMR